MSPTFSTSAAFVALPIIPLLALLLLFFSHDSGLATFSSSSTSSATSEFWRNFGNNASSAANNITASLSAYQVAPAKAPPITFPKKPDYSCSTSSAAPAASPIGEAGDNRDTKLIRASSSLRNLEAKLVGVRASIREAALFARNNSTSIIINHTTSTDHDYSESESESDQDYVPKGHIYRNPSAFHRSYLEMEKLMKIYVYEEGERPLFHDGPCRSIYSMEGRFIHEIEKGLFRTRDPNKAVVYFLPFSVVKLVQFLYTRDLHDKRPMRRVVIDYVKLLAHKHPFWNRSLGADHFMLSCHDWGPSTSAVVAHLYHRSIRALCNANTLEGFRPSKDVSIPEINLEKGEIRGLGGPSLSPSPSPSPSTRTILAFFAGHLHGYTRYLLLNQWKNKDPDLQVYEQLPRQLSYHDMMRKSKFCLCPSGYEVASPRVVEAIYAECVPVLISDGYVPPFSDVLNWKSFSLQLNVNDIPNIKHILTGISTRHYLRLHTRVKMVQRHFVINSTPLRYDVFHMILHSVWLRRLNVRFQDTFSTVTHTKLFHNQTNQNH